MSERLERRAEVVKLARLLEVSEAELPDLDSVPPDQVRRLRELATDRLFDETGQALGRIRVASRMVPAAVSATIAQRAFGPLLCARAAAAVDPSRAVDIASHLSPAFLADVAVQLDPRRVADVVAAVPDRLAVPVAVELAARREHVTMGRFLGFVPDPTVRVTLEALDEEAILRTAFVLEHKDRLDDAVGLLAPGRVREVLAAADRLHLWDEALDLLGHLSEERGAEVAGVLAGLPDDVVTGLLRTVHDQDLWESLLPVVGRMGPAARERLATLPASPEVDALRDRLPR